MGAHLVIFTNRVLAWRNCSEARIDCRLLDPVMAYSMTKEHTEIRIWPWNTHHRHCVPSGWQAIKKLATLV